MQGLETGTNPGRLETQPSSPLQAAYPERTNVELTSPTQLGGVGKRFTMTTRNAAIRLATSSRNDG